MAISTHRDLQLPQPPDDRVTIWRYVDVPRFLSMVSASALFFARADTFTDRFEGSLSTPTVPLRDTYLTGEQITAEDWEAVIHLQRTTRQRVFVNCWHMNEHESVAMWQLYAGGGRAVALRSTYGALKRELGDRAALGVVQYIDYTSDPMPPVSPFHALLYKRKSFEHEREVRALHYEGWDDYPPEGKNLSVKLNAFIEAVAVSPDAPGWYVDTLAAVCHKFDWPIAITRSSLEGEPLY